MNSFEIPLGKKMVDKNVKMCTFTKVYFYEKKK